ncbi:MAG TPA: GNAT family N-acetyltransferase [Bacteroidota bacterium]|nr:GNAT family N-acetyltransferase [Bacteroidota bacterium]
MHHIARNGDFEVSTDPGRLDLDAIHDFLRRSPWAEGIPRETLQRAIANSLCFGASGPAGFVGFARVISDRATYAYLADVFVLEAFRGRGIGKLLMRAIMSHPELQGLSRWCLLTRDAHGLYRQSGFESPRHPELYMEISVPGIYARKEPSNE